MHQLGMKCSIRATANNRLMLHGLTFPLCRWHLALLIIVCMLGFTPADARQTSSPPPNPTITSAPALLVHIKDLRYLPEAVTVKIGQSIEFVNDDQTGHTVTASDSSFDSGYLPRGGTWRVSFSRAQQARYSDIYHPAMHGVITVVVQ